MNHIRRGPPGSPAPSAAPGPAGESLPRYAFEGEDVDDAAETTERAPVSAAAARRIVRRRVSRADTTDEVELTDILLEAYVDEPARPTRRVEDAAVDALLSATSRADETPSLGPMLVSSPPPPLWPSTAPTSFRAEPPPAASRAGAFAGLGLVLVAAGALLGAGAVLRFQRPETAARSARASSGPIALVSAVRAASARATSPTTAAVPSAPPAVAVAALPPPRVAPDRARLVLPATARGHRVFYDGVLVGEGARDVLVACGKKHTLRIGSGGAAREIEPPCGGELDLR